MQIEVSFSWVTSQLWSFSWTGWKTSCFPLQRGRKGEASWPGGGLWSQFSTWRIWLDAAQTVSCITQIVSDLHLTRLYLCQTLATSLPMPFCDSPSPFFLGNINPNGFYQCFVFLSVLPCLPLLFSFQVHSISELWSTHDLSDGGLEASSRCVYVCRVEGTCPTIC